MGTTLVTATSYQTELFPKLAASMVALAGLLRNASAAIVAALIDPLTKAMGRGWFFTGLGIVDLLGAGGILVVMVMGRDWGKEEEGAKGGAKEGVGEKGGK